MDLAKNMATMGNYCCWFANISKIFSTEKSKWFVSKYKWCLWSPLQRFLIYWLSCSGEKHGGDGHILFQKLQSCYLLQIHKNRIGGVMVSVLVSSVVDCGFEPRSGQTKDTKIGICCFSPMHAALRRKNKDWLARNQDNVLSGATCLSADCCFSELAL
jgi:hypothetical protein